MHSFSLTVQRKRTKKKNIQVDGTRTRDLSVQTPEPFLSTTVLLTEDGSSLNFIMNKHNYSLTIYFGCRLDRQRLGLSSYNLNCVRVFFFEVQIWTTVINKIYNLTEQKKWKLTAGHSPRSNREVETSQPATHRADTTGDRTGDLSLRSPTPYALHHGGSPQDSSLFRLRESSIHTLHLILWHWQHVL